MTENYVGSQLLVRDYSKYYYEDTNNVEIDFVIVKDNNIVPVEVKSGLRTRSTSLNSYISKHDPEYAIRISEKNLGFENGIKSISLYAVFCI